MYQRMLVPLDGSDLSKWVLRRAKSLLERPGVQVRLVTVIEAPEEDARDLGFRVDPRHLPTRDELAATRDQLMLERIAADAELLFGDPATEILREVAGGAYDVVAMTTHGRTGVSRILFGSVAFKILRASPVPLLLFRPMQRPDGTLSPVERWDPADFRRVLVPLDGSETAEEILPHTRRLAETFGSRLFFFSAVPGGAESEDRRLRALEYLQRRARDFESQKIPCEARVRVGAAAEEALTLIDELRLDAVAMTTHGRTGLERALYGSVAEKILTHAEVPMLLIRNRRLRAPLPVPAEGAGHAAVD